MQPLVALIRDQLKTLTSLGIKAIGYIPIVMVLRSVHVHHDRRFWHDQDDDLRAACERQIDPTSNTHPTFVFLTPERLQLPSWQGRLASLVAKGHVARFVIDEAQCVLDVSDLQPSPTTAESSFPYFSGVGTLDHRFDCSAISHL